MILRISIQLKLLGALFSIALLLCIRAGAVPVSLEDQLGPENFEQFESLLIFNASRMTQLKKIWQLADKNDEVIAWNGSTVRKFIQWNARQLQSHSFDEVREMPLPSLENLQPPGGYDTDLVGPVRFAKKTSEILGDGIVLDYFDFENYLDLVAIGGPTFEKVMLTSHKIIDPLGGLRHYFQGRLVFHDVPHDEFVKLQLVQNQDRDSDIEEKHFKTNEALRFLRFLYNYPELTPDQDSIKKIRNIGEEELGLFNSDERRYQLFQVAYKLLVSSDLKHPEKLIKSLIDYNLLKILAISGLYADKYKVDVVGLVSGGQLEGISKENALYALQIFGDPNAKNKRAVSAFFAKQESASCNELFN